MKELQSFASQRDRILDIPRGNPGILLTAHWYVHSWKAWERWGDPYIVRVRINTENAKNIKGALLI